MLRRKLTQICSHNFTSEGMCGPVLRKLSAKKSNGVTSENNKHILSIPFKPNKLHYNAEMCTDNKAAASRKNSD
jgi:hypothetical protein